MTGFGAWATARLIPFVDEKVRSLARDLATELSKATPKDTTHAASNWPWGQTESQMPEGSKEAVSWSGFYAGLAFLARYTITMGNLIMTNAVHYMDDLDRGYSSQAKPGFISLTIRRVVARYTK